MNYIKIKKENIDKEHICCAMFNKQCVAKKDGMAESGLTMVKKYVHLTQAKTVVNFGLLTPSQARSQLRHTRILLSIALHLLFCNNSNSKNYITEIWVCQVFFM